MVFFDHAVVNFEVEFHYPQEILRSDIRRIRNTGAHEFLHLKQKKRFLHTWNISIHLQLGTHRKAP